MKARPQHMIVALTLALALSTALIGSAQAADRPDNRAGIRGIGSQSTDPSDVVTRAVARAHAIQTVRPDDRAGLRSAGTVVAGNAPIATATSADFQWADAGFGAAATLALILTLAGLVFAGASRHRNHAILD